MTAEALQRGKDVLSNVFRLYDDAKLLDEHERYSALTRLRFSLWLEPNSTKPCFALAPAGRLPRLGPGRSR
jgi:hypothetical protein